jgi:hypothetical protein
MYSVLQFFYDGFSTSTVGMEELAQQIKGTCRVLVACKRARGNRASGRDRTDWRRIKVNPLLLQLRPDPLGPQHDEREPGFWGIRWPKGLRHVDPEAILHSSVYARAAAVRVPHFYSAEEYSPENLADHIKFQVAKADGNPPPKVAVARWMILISHCVTS